MSDKTKQNIAPSAEVRAKQEQDLRDLAANTIHFDADGKQIDFSTMPVPEAPDEDEDEEDGE